MTRRWIWVVENYYKVDDEEKEKENLVDLNDFYFFINLSIVVWDADDEWWKCMRRRKKLLSEVFF